jgi:hypothetical protein
MGISLSVNFRTAENLRVIALQLHALEALSLLIRPAHHPGELVAVLIGRRGGRPLLPAELVFALPRPGRIDALASAAPITPRNSAIERIAFVIASEIVARREEPDAGRYPPSASVVSNPRPVVTSMVAETGQLAPIALRGGLTQPRNLASGV